MREIRQSGSEGGEGDKRPSLPLSVKGHNVWRQPARVPVAHMGVCNLPIGSAPASPFP